MRKSNVVLCLAIAHFAVGFASAKIRYVNNTTNTNQCPLQFSTIQSAVDASGVGDTVTVCAGTYNEQVNISMRLTLTGQSGAIIAPRSPVVNVPDVPAIAVVYVHDASGVTINNLTIDGSVSGLTGCAPDFDGIYFSNASGTIVHNAVKFIQTPPNYGCQTGLSILVDNTHESTQNVTIQANSIHDFQKNGITVDGTGISTTISGNTITGFGPTSQTAQNGIQVSDGATGTISGNVLNGMAYIACADCTAYAATGMLIYESPGLTVSGNIIAQTNVGIYYFSDAPSTSTTTISSNRISNTLVYDGIDIVGDSAVANLNSVTDSDESGIYVDGASNKVTNNTIIETPIGLYLDQGTTLQQQNGNKFFLVPTSVYSAPPVAPVAPGHRASISPFRKTASK